MLSCLQTDYQRLEQSLQRLTDSIAAYNPSPAAAEELVVADEIITKDLDLCTSARRERQSNADLKLVARHQTNHARIQELRRTADSLDSTLKSTIQLLARTRQEIKAIPAYNVGQSGEALQVDRLLAYAKFISKTSVPPTRRVEAAQKDEAEKKPALTNGTTPVVVNGDTQTDSENVGVKSLDDQVKRMLDPFKDLPFEPWPAYHIIQQGALADIQRMIDAGKDPASVLSAVEQAEADRLKAEEEDREKQEHEERERRRMSMYAGGGRAAAQDDVFDPDEA